MDAATELPLTPTSAEVSLVRGGPFYRAQRAVGLIRPNQWNLGRRIAFLIALVEFTRKKVTFATQILNLRGTDPVLVLALGYSLWCGFAKGSQLGETKKHRLPCAFLICSPVWSAMKSPTLELLGYDDLRGLRVAHPVGGSCDASPDGILKTSWPLRHD